MGLFNLFKKKEDKIITHPIIVKRKQNKNIYMGQIVSIEPDIDDNDNVRYYLSSYNDGYVSNKISKKDAEICEKYKYALIRNFDNDNIQALVICCDGYLMRLKVELKKKFNNGDAFIIKNNDLFENNEKIGIITDDRYDPNLNIVFNELENDKLVVFIKK